MSQLNDLFADYASYHQTAGNKWFHRVGIPLIMLSALGMLAHINFFRAQGFRIDVAMVVVLAATIYYISLDWRLGALMFVVSVAFYFIGAAIPFWVNVALFVLGWIFQFIGHSVYEKRQPAFFRNFVHLLIGPLWILNDAIPVVKVTLPE